MVENKLLPKEIDPALILDDRFVKNAKLWVTKSIPCNACPYP
jgi:hypothetical protein